MTVPEDVMDTANAKVSQFVKQTNASITTARKFVSGTSCIIIKLKFAECKTTNICSSLCTSKFALEENIYWCGAPWSVFKSSLLYNDGEICIPYLFLSSREPWGCSESCQSVHYAEFQAPATTGPRLDVCDLAAPRTPIWASSDTAPRSPSRPPTTLQHPTSDAKPDHQLATEWPPESAGGLCYQGYSWQG